MIPSKIRLGDTEIGIEHQECSDASWCKDKDIFIESSSSDNNTLSTITVNGNLTIRVFWESSQTGVSQEILFVPETGILFLGCGSISARISTKENKLVGFEDVFLFWGLDRHKYYVLETGELECFLYSLSGDKISTADVDPPYEMEVKKEGIRFDSIVHGTTWLKYE